MPYLYYTIFSCYYFYYNCSILWSFRLVTCSYWN
nr:MAG TPA: hypothetical protein [Herelleviridae sp.]